MPDTLPADERRRWAEVARRTHELGATTHVEHAIETRPILGPSALEAAEAALDALDAEPDPLETP